MKPIAPRLTSTAQTRSFLENAAAFFIIITLFAFAYLFFGVVILAFSSVLVAVLLTLLARPLHRRLKLHNLVALSLAGLLLVALVGVTAYLFGTRLALDVQDVLTRMEDAQKTIRADLNSSPLGQFALSHLGVGEIPVSRILTSIFSVSTSVMAGVVVAVIAGIYFAAQPSLYLNGFLTLFPPDTRPRAEETAKDVGMALYLWLEGQFISMLLVGLLSTLATWAIGLPSPLALGLIAGIAEFVPYVGPILAAVPALLVAATQGQSQILWTLVAYLGIHLCEGNVIAPLIQRQMVYIPPAVMILGIAAISFIFGTVAIIFAAPMTVALFVLVKKLYVRDVLKEPTVMPGEKN